MADDEIVVPEIQIDAADLANIRANLGLEDGPAPSETGEVVTFPPPKRRRGRPRKHPLTPEQIAEREAKAAAAENDPVVKPTDFVPPAKLGKREEREVAERLAKMLTGGTGVASMAKPYLQMTDEEAKDIADPLASYLVRNADTIPIAGQILENYDLAAILFGVMAYVVRVYSDRRNEVISTRPAVRASSRQPETSFMDSVSASQNGNNGGQPVEGSHAFVSTPHDERAGL